MADEHTEHLLIVADTDHYATILDALRRRGTVTQQLPPTLALVVVAPHMSTQAPAGAALYADDVPIAVIDRLTPSERLFVAAWRMRRTDGPQERRERPGDGLDWDAPGFKPPDGPGGSAG